MNGFHGGCAKIRVLGECFASINTHYFKAENFFFEFKGEFCSGWSVKWVALKEAFGFGRDMKKG